MFFVAQNRREPRAWQRERVPIIPICHSIESKYEESNFFVEFLWT